MTLSRRDFYKKTATQPQTPKGMRAGGREKNNREERVTKMLTANEKNSQREPTECQMESLRSRINNNQSKIEENKAIIEEKEAAIKEAKAIIEKNEATIEKNEAIIIKLIMIMTIWNSLVYCLNLIDAIIKNLQ